MRPPVPRHDARDPRRFWLELVERLGYQGLEDSSRLEIGTDREIAELATGKRQCPLAREPRVVDELRH